MDRDELITTVQAEVKGLRSKFEEEDWELAVSDALRDTGWMLPVTNDTMLFWLKKRFKRHLFFMLYTESAHKFKFKQYNLQHRFDHYGKLIERMDKEWETFVNEELLLLEGVGAFATKVDAGFQYDEHGHDTTYSEDNRVTFSPDQND